MNESRRTEEKFEPEQMKRLVAAWNAGVEVSLVSNRFGLTYSAIREQLNKARVLGLRVEGRRTKEKTGEINGTS
jgi:hypothetical protein